MSTITVKKSKKTGKITQATVTIPIEIMQVMGWKDGTEILFVPYIQDANTKITRDTPILLKKIEAGKTDESK
jgi:hypothetical protein